MKAIISIFNKVHPQILLLFAAIFVIFGDYTGKLWSRNPTLSLFILTILIYALYSITYIPVLLRRGLIVTSFNWTLISDIGVIFIGIILFHEHLSAYQVCGVILSLIAIYLLEIE